ncbi:MAG: type II toxin-antitoxin system RelE/ParE family toxin [Gammaproteobacteria bacterium]|nr:type II toxin-antitoxin system RelE/ParE family toxin [Gammaproteobacteria bacterium]
MLEENVIEVFETPMFKKTFKRLSNPEKDLVEEEIDKIIKDPDIGEQKKGDLSHLWVHKFNMNNQQVLLGYSWKEAELELYLLNIGRHENFYRDTKNRRKQDLKILR